MICKKNFFFAIGVANFEYLRNTNGMPPRIAFFPSKTANLLLEKKNKIFRFKSNKEFRMKIIA